MGLGYLLKFLVVDGFRLHLGEVELAFLLTLSNKRVALGVAPENSVGLVSW